MKVTSQMWSSTCLTPTFLPGKDLGDVDFAGLVAEPPTRGDDGGPIVSGIVQRLHAAVHPRGRLVAARRGRHIERLMGSLLVIAMHKRIEARLLLQKVGDGGAGRFLFQRQVHALVAPILFWVPRRNALQADAEP